MDTLSTLITSNPDKPNRSLSKTIYSTILCIATFTSLFLLHGYSPGLLWLAANAIIFSVYKLSSSDPQPYSQPIIVSLPSDTWHDYPSPSLAEPEPIAKEVPHVQTVGEEDGEVAKDVNMDDTWKEITMRRASAAARKPSLKKSDTWERRQPCLQRADVGMKRELKKSSTYKEGREKPAAYDRQVEEKESKGDTGWRTREVLVVAHDELFRRVENFIKEQHDHLRLQRQESEYRRFLERFRK